MSDIDRAELRRLLGEAHSELPWEAEGSQIWGPDGVLVAAAREHSTLVDRPDALIIAAAVNALPDLLDALDAIHELAGQIADHYGDNWDHTSACMGEPACPLCLILHIASGGTPDEDALDAAEAATERVPHTQLPKDART